MSGLTQTIADLADSLADSGYPVKNHVPEKVAPPLLIIGAGNPYLELSDAFNTNEMVLNVEVILLVRSGTNSSEIKSLNLMLEEVMPHFPDAWVIRVDGPEVVSVNESLYLSCRIAASTQFELN